MIRANAAQAASREEPMNLGDIVDSNGRLEPKSDRHTKIAGSMVPANGTCQSEAAGPDSLPRASVRSLGLRGPTWEKQGLGMPDPNALPDRLLAVAAWVEAQAVLADIGTDHARLPAYLVAQGQCPRAIACDLRLAPLRQARDNLHARGLKDKVEVRQGNGCAPIRAGEVQNVTITGLGAATILKILGGAAHLLQNHQAPRRWIIQPNNGAEALRRAAPALGLALLNEDVVRDRGRLYWLLAFAPSRNPTPAWNEDELACGPLVRMRPSPAYLAWLADQVKLAQTRMQGRGNRQVRAAFDLQRYQQALAFAAAQPLRPDA